MERAWTRARDEGPHWRTPRLACPGRNVYDRVEYQIDRREGARNPCRRHNTDHHRDDVPKACACCPAMYHDRSPPGASTRQSQERRLSPRRLVDQKCVPSHPTASEHPDQSLPIRACHREVRDITGLLRLDRKGSSRLCHGNPNNSADRSRKNAGPKVGVFFVKVGWRRRPRAVAQRRSRRVEDCCQRGTHGRLRQRQPDRWLAGIERRRSMISALLDRRAIRPFRYLTVMSWCSASYDPMHSDASATS